MDKMKTASAVAPARGRKRHLKVTVSEPKNSKLLPSPDATAVAVVKKTHNAAVQKTPMPPIMYKRMTMDEIGARYPVLQNEELVNRFLKVPMTNNQKGRIRQMLKDHFQGTSDVILPDVINNRIQAILKSSPNLTDTDLRKLRILYNMLKTAATTKPTGQIDTSPIVIRNVEVTDKIEDKDKKKEKVVKNQPDRQVKSPKESLQNQKNQQNQKGPKRYVVFLGNLPLHVDKDKIKQHFWELSDFIKDVRIPKRTEDKRTAIAYVELLNEPSFELALSKHHSMLGGRRIKVLYTTQKKGKVTKAEAKGKAAKMVALQKSGKLLGSIPLNRKRSQRRKKMKAAQAKENTA